MRLHGYSQHTSLHLRCRSTGLVQAALSSHRHAPSAESAANTQHWQMLDKVLPMRGGNRVATRNVCDCTPSGMVPAELPKDLTASSLSHVVPPAGDNATQDFNENKGGVCTLDGTEKQGPSLGERPVQQSIVTSAMLHLPLPQPTHLHSPPHLLTQRPLPKTPRHFSF